MKHTLPEDELLRRSEKYPAEYTSEIVDVDIKRLTSIVAKNKQKVPTVSHIEYHFEKKQNFITFWGTFEHD